MANKIELAQKLSVRMVPPGQNGSPINLVLHYLDQVLTVAAQIIKAMGCRRTDIHIGYTAKILVFIIGKQQAFCVNFH